MFEVLKKKYENGFVRNDQLLRYVTVGLITEAQYDQIINA